MTKTVSNGLRTLLTAAIALTATLGARPASAATFPVNTSDDSQDISPGDGLCSDGFGRCSLRAAVEETNATPHTVHLIDLGVATYVLPLGELQLRGNQIIRGISKDDTFIQGVSGSRIFFLDTPGRVDILNVTVQNGEPRGGALNPGGGMWMYHGSAYVSGSRFTQNWGTPGGAISVQDGTLDMQYTEISNNHTDLVNASSGVQLMGGGLKVYGGAVARIWSSTFYGNEAQHGGAINNGGYMEVSNSTFHGNTSRSAGGALFQNGGESWLRLATT